MRLDLEENHLVRKEEEFNLTTDEVVLVRIARALRRAFDVEHYIGLQDSVSAYGRHKSAYATASISRLFTE